MDVLYLVDVPYHTNDDIMKTFCAHITNPNPIDNDGRTPLHTLCTHIPPTLYHIKTILEAGGDLDVLDNNDETPRYYLNKHCSPEQAESIGALEREIKQERNGKALVIRSLVATAFNTDDLSHIIMDYVGPLNLVVPPARKVHTVDDCLHCKIDRDGGEGLSCCELTGVFCQVWCQAMADRGACSLQ